jgi:hypothetical protein
MTVGQLWGKMHRNLSDIPEIRQQTEGISYGSKWLSILLSSFCEQRLHSSS